MYGGGDVGGGGGPRRLVCSTQGVPRHQQLEGSCKECVNKVAQKLCGSSMETAKLCSGA